MTLIILIGLVGKAQASGNSQLSAPTGYSTVKPKSSAAKASVAKNSESLFAEVIKKSQDSQTDALMIYQDGQVVYDSHRINPNIPISVQSITKSLIAIAILKLLEDKKIPNLDLPMYHFIPEWYQDSDRQKITVKMLLNHTSGICDCDGFLKQPDFIQFAKKAPLQFKPGTGFLYSTVAVALLERVITRVTHEPAEYFIQQNILSPLDISGVEWNYDENNHIQAGGGMFASPRDLLKIGVMLANQGVYAQQRILSEASVKLLSTKSQPFENYGLLFWLYKSAGSEKSDVFAARGYGGQYILVNPSKKQVIVRVKDPRKISTQNLSQTEFLELTQLMP
jgi:CubicO group peptidase (beta-lactamase class C family)